MRSYKILHLVDCYLPETMSWLGNLLEGSSQACEHMVHTDFLISKPAACIQVLGEKRVVPYPLQFKERLKSFLYHRRRVAELRRIVSKLKPDIIHVHFGHVAVRYFNLLEELELPFCISLYGFDYEHLPFKNPETREIYVRLSEKGAYFIVEGSYSRHLLETYGVPRQQIFPIHLLSSLDFKRNSRSFGQPVTCIQAASFTEKKNQLGLIEALRERHANRISIQLIGEPADKSYFREVKAALAKKRMQSVHISDVLPYSTYLDCIAQSDFALQFSKRAKNHDTEGGCPVFIKDALLMSTPVCTSRHCDIPETVVHGFNGFLTDEGDSSQITEIIDSILGLSPRQYQKLALQAGQSLRINALDNLCCRELLYIYNALIAGSFQ